MLNKTTPFTDTMIVKYPRTCHLPFSPGGSTYNSQSNDSFYSNKEVIVSLLMDGENFNCYSNYCHGKRLENHHHWTRTWVQYYHEQFKHLIPFNHRVCGENLFAQHYIHYDNLKSYFLVHSIWNGYTCLSYQDTLSMCTKLSLKHVPVLYQGVYDKEQIKSIADHEINNNGQEGIVVRLADSFHFNQFDFAIGKYAKEKQEQIEHWNVKLTNDQPQLINLLDSID